MLFSGFTIEEVAKVQSEIKSGDSLTLSFIEFSHQSNPVTLGNIMHMFHELDRMDILRELEKLTAVRFEVRTDADNVSSMSALRPPQAIAEDLDQFNNGSKNDNDKINKHAEKHNASEVSELGNREVRVDVKNGKKRVEVSPRAEYSGHSQESVEQSFKTNRNGEIHGNVAQTDEINLAETNCNIQVYNNLDMSTSSSSSNTENSMYDTLPDTSSFKDIEIDQEQKMISVKSNYFGGRDELVGIREEIDNDNRDTVITVKMVEQNEKYEIVQYSAVQETKASGIVETDLRQTCDFPKISTVSGYSSLQADFERRKLEGKLLDVKMNISEMFSQSDQQESEDFSLSQSIPFRNPLSTGETKANTATLSINHSADQDLEDEIAKRTDIPKLSIGSSDVNSIKRKAAKKFRYYGQDCGNHDVLFDNDNREYSDESFQINFDFNDQAPSTDGYLLLYERSEQKLRAVQPCDQYDGQSNELLHYSVQQPPNIVNTARFNDEEDRQSNEIALNTNEDKESEITARGPTIRSDNESSKIKMTLCDSKTELKGMHVEHSDNKRGMHEKQQVCSKVSMNNIDNVTVVKPSLENSGVEVLENGNVQDVESDDSDGDNVADTNRAITEYAIIKRASTDGAGTDRAAKTYTDKVSTDASIDRVNTDASIDRDSTNRRQGVEPLSTMLNVAKTVYDCII